MRHSQVIVSDNLFLNFFYVIEQHHGLNDDCLVTVQDQKTNKTFVIFNVTIFRTDNQCTRKIVGLYFKNLEKWHLGKWKLGMGDTDLKQHHDISWNFFCGKDINDDMKIVTLNIHCLFGHISIQLWEPCKHEHWSQ